MAVVAAIAATVPAEARGQGSRPVDGTYVFAGDATQRESHRRSIEAAVRQVNVFLQPVARSNLLRYLKIPPSVIFRSSGNQMTIAVPPYPPRASRLDGSELVYDATNGASASLRREVQGSDIVETVTQNGVTRVIRYTFDRARETVTMHWSISVPRYFRTPIRFDLTYRRA